MNLPPRSQAIMLLTVSFGKSDAAGAKPLSTKEWARFAAWMKDLGLDPSALLKGDLNDRLSGWEDRSITLPRIERLLDRGAALGFALEKWQRAGLWSITRSDPEYPKRLKRKLRLESPPVLFGCGNKMLLDRGGIAVVGSRDAEPDDVAFAERLAEAAAMQGYSVVSGGARGIDQRSMLGALRKEGTAVGILADSLLREATSAKYRDYILSGDLTLMTPFNPEAGFQVGNAMSRNRYIYCLSEAAVAVSSTRDKGGTWNGALENLKFAWVPLWVKWTANPEAGNAGLVQKGARWLPDDLNSLESLSRDATVEAADEASRPLPEAERPATTEPGAESRADPEIETSGKRPKSTPETVDENAPGVSDFYAMFLDRMRGVTADGPMKADEIASRLELQKAQASVWLKRGLSDGRIEKTAKPVRYRSTENMRRQASSPETVGENAPGVSDFYAMFLDRMRGVTADGPMKADEIASRLELQKAQASVWLKRGLSDGRIEKTAKPVRYRSTENVQRQASFPETVGENAPGTSDFYAMFLDRMRGITADGPMKTDEIASRLELQKAQASVWLKRGLSDGRIEKTAKPVRYRSTENVRRQASLFSGND